ncbi:MAG: hypothetical protein KDD24_03255 [Flavobacteriales bacterium]|nr:hypothetical protein [Flavobacteriales bacterium]MCB9175337.1 hypothetical protein [Flavobacteriales bacterium]
MKLTFSLFLLIFSTVLLAQTVANIGNKKSIYVYNNQQDTIYLSKINIGNFCNCDLKITDSVQIDGIGAKELVFFRSCSGSINEHGGTFDIDENTQISKYEIWNLDTKEMLFEAVTSYQSNYNRFLAYGDPKHVKGFEFSSCGFKIDRTGSITISNVKSDAKAHTYEWKTVKKKGKTETIVEEVPYTNLINHCPKEGTHVFVNGKYVLE